MANIALLETELADLMDAISEDMFDTGYYSLRDRLDVVENALHDAREDAAERLKLAT